jgi:hypothetical protein
MTFQRIFPAKLYEGIGGELTPIKSVVVSSIIANNVSVVAGIAGKRIRLMGLMGFANTAAGLSQILFKNGSGGAFLTNGILLDINTKPTLGLIMPIQDAGYFETSTGTGLFVDVLSAAAAITVFYVDYTAD